MLTQQKVLGLAGKVHDTYPAIKLELHTDNIYTASTKR